MGERGEERGRGDKEEEEGEGGEGRGSHLTIDPHES